MMSRLLYALVVGFILCTGSCGDDGESTNGLPTPTATPGAGVHRYSLTGTVGGTAATGRLILTAGDRIGPNLRAYDVTLFELDGLVGTGSGEYFTLSNELMLELALMTPEGQQLVIRGTGHTDIISGIENFTVGDGLVIFTGIHE